MFAGDKNPLRSESVATWDRVIDAIGPASILVVIDSRMGSLLRGQLSADDIFQEALLRAWRDRGHFEWRGLKSFRSWFLTLVDHSLRDAADYHGAAKRGGGRPAVPFSALQRHDRSSASGFAGPVATTTPSRVAMYTEQAAAMHAALGDLPEDVRDVVRRRLFEQRSMQQIADEIGIGLSAVRHRFRKGAALYQQHLVTEFASRSIPPSQDFAERTAPGMPGTAS